MTDKEIKSCVKTLELLRRLALNIHGVIDVVDDENIDKMIDMLQNSPTLMSGTSDLISRQATIHLDLFTKTYCRDKTVLDDLVFRCKECEFELPDGTCLVKKMARRLSPDYKDFGSMGDL